MVTCQISDAVITMNRGMNVTNGHCACLILGTRDDAVNPVTCFTMHY